MEAMELNDIRQALSREYSLEIDGLIRGEYTDKTRARNLKRIMNNLPRIEDGDRELVAEVTAAYLCQVDIVGLEPMSERAERIDRAIMKGHRCRRMHEYKEVDGITRLKVLLVNDFHGTSVEVWPEVVDDFTVMFTPDQVAECKETLCPDGRQCVGLLGERWRGPGYADVFKKDTEGNVYAKAISFFADPCEPEPY